MASGYLEVRTETGAAPLNEFGTGPYGTKTIYIPAITFTPALNAAPLSRDDELRGTDEPQPVLPERYAPNWSVETRAYPDTLGFLLTWMLGTPATTAGTVADLFGGTVHAGAYRHRWTAPFRTGSYPQTATVRAAYKDQAVYFKQQGCALETLTITSPDTGGVRLAASGPALYMQRISDPALSPAYEAIAVPPFQKSHLTMPGWLSNTSTHQDLTISLSNPVDVTASMGVASRYPDIVEKGGAPVTLTGSLPQRQLGTPDYDALLNATAFSGTVKWVSTEYMVAGSAKPYHFAIGMSNVQYTDGDPGALVNQRRIGGNFNFKASNAGSTSVLIELVNLTSSYT